MNGSKRVRWFDRLCHFRHMFNINIWPERLEIHKQMIFPRNYVFLVLFVEIFFDKWPSAICIITVLRLVRILIIVSLDFNYMDYFILVFRNYFYSLHKMLYNLNEEESILIYYVYYILLNENCLIDKYAIYFFTWFRNLFIGTKE